MITYFQSFILGGLQGIAELFPISSLGHSVIFPSLFGWRINQSSNLFLIFLVCTHLATALVLLGFFFKDWVLIIKGFFRSIKNRKINHNDIYEKLSWLIIVGTIPAGILGLLFEKKFKLLFASPKTTAIFLVFNGVMLLIMELFRKRKSIDIKYSGGENERADSDANISRLSIVQAIKVGVAQCLALFPGFSRTGATMGGGLLIGLNHEDSLRFSFLLATPIILAASILKVPQLFHSEYMQAGIMTPIILGSVTSAVTAFLSIKFLTRYFETKKLTPFAIYCIAFGLICSMFFLNQR